MTLTVVCLLVRGPFAYTPAYVYRLQRMVRRHLARPFRFVCLTDDPAQLPGIETIWVEGLGGVVPANGVGYWNKLRVFDRRLGWSGRCLFLDLDTLVVDALDPIVDAPASLALSEDALVVERAHLNRDRYGRALVRRFNSSVMVWDAGRWDALFETWSPVEALRLSTDQDWIGERALEAQPLPLAWFPRIAHCPAYQARAPKASWPPAAKVVLVKKPKNHLVAAQWPAFDVAWGGGPESSA